MNGNMILVAVYDCFSSSYKFIKDLKAKLNIQFGLVRHFYTLIKMTMRFNSMIRADFINGWFLIIATKVNSRMWKRRMAVDSSSKRIRALAFNREGFWKDLVEIDKRTDIEILYFPQSIYTFFADAFLPEKLRSQLAYHVKDSNKIRNSIWIKNEIGDNNINEAIDHVYKDNLRKAIDCIYDQLKRAFRFDVVLSSHIQFYQDQEWIKVMEAHGTPFVALVKEGFGNRDQCKAQLIALSELEFKYAGSLIAVHCEELREMFLKAGVVNDSEKLLVTGAARTDAILGQYANSGDLPKIPAKDEDEEWIVFFDFFHFQNMALIDSYIDLQRLWEDTIDVLVKQSGSTNGREVKIIAKTKLDVNSVALNDYAQKKYGENIKLIINDALEFGEIAKKATMIVGFRTTALIEFMGMDVPLVILNWAEAAENPDLAMFTDQNDKAYTMANSKVEFEELIVQHLRSDNYINEDQMKMQRESRDKIINKHLFKIDGKRSKYIAGMIENIIS